MLIARRNLGCILSLWMLVGLSHHASALELAINGGFETGDDTGWTQFIDTRSTFTIESGSPKSGSYSGKINNVVEGLPAVVKQANLGVGVVKPGQAITINFWARGSAAEGGVHFAELFSELSGGGVSKSEILSGGPLFPPSDSTWTEYTFNTTLGSDVSGGVTLQLNAPTGAMTNSISTFEFDDVSISIDTGSTLMCDADGDGDCEQDDINAMYAAFGATDRFDYDNNNATGPSDIAGWLTDASSSENTYNTGNNTFAVGDANLDGNVDSTDLGQLLNNFGSTTALQWLDGNNNGDSIVDSGDLGQLLNSFGTPPAAASSVPEPTSHFLSLICGLFAGGMAFRRSRIS